jgi:putative transcriptional regulator
MKSLQGHLLIAAPELHDPNFFRSVVLLVRHGDEGALGVILNRPSKTTVREAWEQVRDTPCPREAPLHLGGPCQGPLMAVHTLPLWSEGQVAAGVYFSADPEQLEQLVAREDDAAHVKFVIGYAGWGAGQLENELEEGSWQVLPADAGTVFNADPNFWEKTLREAASRQFLAALKIKHVPHDPNMN